MYLISCLEMVCMVYIYIFIYEVMVHCYKIHKGKCYNLLLANLQVDLEVLNRFHNLHRKLYFNFNNVNNRVTTINTFDQLHKNDISI